MASIPVPPPRPAGVLRQAALFAARVVAIGRWRMALALAQTVLLGVTAGAGLLVLIPLVSLTGVDAEFQDLGLARRVSDAFAWMGAPVTLPLVLAVFLAVTIGQALLARWQAHVSFDLHRAVMATLREELYDAIVSCRWVFFSRLRSTDLSYALTTLAHTAGAGVHQLIALGSGCTVAAAHLAIAVYLSPAATAAALGGGVVLGWLLHRDTRQARALAEVYLADSSALHGASVEHLQSFKTMKSVGAERQSARLFRAANERLAATQRRSIVNDQRQRFTFEVGSALVLVVMVVLALRVAHLSTGALLLLLYTFARLMPRVFGVQQNFVQVVHAVPAFLEVHHLTARLREAREPAAAGRPAATLRLEQALSVRRVSFDYGALPVVRDLSLEIPAGRLTALVGASGSGKTTVLDLLMGLLTPASGEILVDGRPLETHPDWRRHVGYVSQESFLFNDTVRANLLWARPDASDASLRAALERASARDFVDALEHGMDTRLGDRGCRLSGGERQRLALARALLGEPTLIILDEATNALDRRNEDRLLDALEALMPEVTIVMVAHRMSCVSRADLVYVLEEGRIVESGTPDALLAQSRRFRELQAVTAATTAAAG